MTTAITDGSPDRACPPYELTPQDDDLPLADLAPYDQFVTWGWVWREGKNGQTGGWTKPPIDPIRGGFADSSKPETWGPLASVIGVHPRYGFVVTERDPFCFLDIDNGYDVDADRVKPWAQAILDRFLLAYWERSPGGRGLKGIMRARPPRNRIIPVGDGKIEVFSSGKFTTLTGWRLPCSALTIGECQAELDQFITDFCPDHATHTEALAPALELSDEAIVAKTLRMAKCRRRYQDGDTTDCPSGSEGNLSMLCCFVSAGTTDPQQLDRLFRSSALYPERKYKWDKRDYRERTITKALDGRVVPFVPTRMGPKPHLAALPIRPVEELPDDVSALKRIIRDLLERLDIAEKRAQAAEATAGMLARVQSATASIVRNKALGQERHTAVALSHQFANREAAGDGGEDGLYPIPLARVAEAVGMSEDAVSKHIGRLVGAGVLRKRVRWVPPSVNPTTGEMRDGHKRQFIGPAGENVLAFVDAVASLTPEKPKTWGGRADRCQPCPDHPDAGVVKRVSFHCAECDQELARLPDELLAAAPNPHLAGLLGDNPAPDRNHQGVVTTKIPRHAGLLGDQLGSPIAWVGSHPTPNAESLPDPWAQAVA